MLDTSAVQLLMIVVCCMMQLSHAGQFTEVPQTVNVTAGNDAVFRCLHSDAEFYGWRIDGRSARTANLSEVSVQSNMLTILALPEYNGTVVECIALYSDGTPSQTSPPALLIVQGSCNNGTVAIAFLEEPESQNVALGDMAEFQCRHPTADYIGWTVNGTSLNSFNPQNVSTTSLVLPDGGSRYILIVGAIPTYNGTVVICVATFSNSCPSQESGPAVLLIQGPLQAVNALVRGVIGGFMADRTYSWNPPPTLDLTGVEPDIAYCITIHNITCGRNDFLVGDCSLTNTFYIYEHIHPRHVHRVEVIPRSNVEKARNGTPLSVDERFVDFAVSSIYFVKNQSAADNVTVTIELTPNATVPGILIVPEQYTVTVRTIDGADKQPMETSRVIGRDNRNVSFSLQRRRLWEYSLWAYGCKEHSIGSFIISTHDVQNITLTSLPGEIRVTGQLIDGATTDRILLIVYSTANESEVQYVFGKVSDESVQTSVYGLKGGVYGGAVFAVEEGGRVSSRVAALPQYVEYIAQGSNGVRADDNVVINYSRNSTSTSVCIMCTFLESSSTDCVAVVHQRISQLNSSGLMNIESSHKFTRSDDTASGCIERVNPTTHQVGVVGGRLVMETDQDIAEQACDIGCVIAAVIVSIVIPVIIIILILIVVLTIKIKRRQKRGEYMVNQNGDGGRNRIRQEDLRQAAQPSNDYEAGVVPTDPERTPLYRQIDDQTSNEVQFTDSPPSEPSIRRGMGGRPRTRAEGEIGQDESTVYAEVSAQTSSKLLVSQSSHETPVLPYAVISHVPTSPNADHTAVAYSDVNTNPVRQGQQCAITRGVSTGLQDDSEPTTVQYSEIKHENPRSTVDPGASPSPPNVTVESLLPELMGVAFKWKSFGEDLSLDEDILDEIDTNNETDEDCLRDMLERCMMRFDLKHIRDTVLRGINMEEEACRVSLIAEEHQAIEEADPTLPNIDGTASTYAEVNTSRNAQGQQDALTGGSSTDLRASAITSEDHEHFLSAAATVIDVLEGEGNHSQAKDDRTDVYFMFKDGVRKSDLKIEKPESVNIARHTFFEQRRAPTVSVGRDPGMPADLETSGELRETNLDDTAGTTWDFGHDGISAAVSPDDVSVVEFPSGQPSTS